jgi:hypothetical protein
LKLVRFYSEGELSSIRMSNEEETVTEVKNLFFTEQIVEEQIMLEIYSKNRGIVSDVDELRLDFDRILTKKQLLKKALLSGCKLTDSAHQIEEFSLSTIISIKNEQRYLTASFRSFLVLIPRNRFVRKPSEPLLFASLKNNNFYLLNREQSQFSPSRFKTFFNWIKKGISFKTFSK